jgi:hypothetical protein
MALWVLVLNKGESFTTVDFTDWYPTTLLKEPRTRRTTAQILTPIRGFLSTYVSSFTIL